jgi:hypothetical protein
MMAMDNHIVHKLIEELRIKISKALEDKNLSQSDILTISQDLDEIIKLLMSN